MTVLNWLLIGIFLPLFPLSLVFNQLLERCKPPLLKAGLLLLWPQLGIALLLYLGEPLQVPAWVLTWAGLTALLYGFRLVTRRDVYGWTGFLATSSWSLLWFPLLLSGQDDFLAGYALYFTLPLLLLVGLAAVLEARFGAAYTHLYGGLAGVMPRFAGLLVFVVLAAIATPVFPGFFMMLKILTQVSHSIGLAVILLLVWLTWSWAGVRFLQGLLVGPYHNPVPAPDLQRCFTWIYALALIVLAVAGLYVMGDMS